jgi:glutathione reductase (NADPH)
MSSYDYDLFTIGAGSGGVRASRIAATLGARVAVAEERYLGGTCVNVGCVPKKLLVYASHFREDFHDAAGFGWTVGDTRFDWSRLIANKNTEIQRLNGIYENLLGNAGVEIINGHARLLDAHTVAVGDKTYTADNILIATGGWPAVPDVPGVEHVITSNEAFFLDRLPERIVVVGGGYIAVEFAGIFHGLGSRVTQLYRGPLFLRGFDNDVRDTLAEEMRKKGIDLRFDAKVSRIEKANGALTVALADGSTVDADVVMYATGRLPKIQGIGLEEAGVRFNDAGAVVVDQYSRSSVPNIYAVGDCTDRINLTPVAIKEGQAVAETLYGGRPTKPDHANVPSAVFSQPPIGSVGLTEAEAAEARPIDVYITRFRPMKHTLAGGDERTMMKIIVDRETDRVLGCHMVGGDAAEIIQGIAIALKCGATKAQFDATVGIHPTAAEEFVTMREKRPGA